tara:strand:+ start:374 stop:1276 length:903 start_codon:yes stop_codon:yes gene_type:complete
MRKTFVENVMLAAANDPKLVVLIGDISHYLFKDFEKQFPDQFYNVGICEQSIVGMAAGMAMQGYRPIVHTIAPFCVNRAFEQIKIDVCYQELDVTFVTVGGSFDYAHLGCTHHCYEDISLMMTLPGMTVFNPGNRREFTTLFQESWASGYPKYFKINKDEHSETYQLKPGDIKVINKNNIDKSVIFVNGPILDRVPKDSNTIVYTPSVSYLTESSIETIKKLVSNNRSRKIITVEENLTIGSFGNKILSIFEGTNIPLIHKKLGIPRKFLTNYGSAKDHRASLKLDKKSIRVSIDEFDKL